jgi:two-component system NtrC family sensor kinase
MDVTISVKSENPMDHIEDIKDKPCVLIVDDSQSIQKYVKELLEGGGFRVFSATDGRIGLKYMEDKKPDVVLLDIEMPLMNGLEMLDELGKSKRLYSIILFSHLSDVRNRIIGLDKGADDYITKPVQPDELLARVRAAARTTKLKMELAKAKKTAEDAIDKFHRTQRKLIREQNMAAITKLACGMAHEINTPLGLIQSNLGTLKRYAGILAEGSKRFIDISDKMKDKDPGWDKALDEILNWLKESKVALITEDIGPLISDAFEGTARISTILDYLLLMDNAVYCTDAEIIDLNTLVKSLNSFSKLRLPPGVILTIDSSDTPLNVTGKNDHLHIAIVNILKNAIEAAGEAGTIKVTTYSENNRACIKIHNSGEAIPQDVLPGIFEPFFTTKASQKKLGVGLTISQYLINANGGHIEVKSCPGEGTSVTISLSQKQEEQGGD